MSLSNMHLSDHTDKNISEICLYMTSTLCPVGAASDRCNQPFQNRQRAWKQQRGQGFGWSFSSVRNLLPNLLSSDKELNLNHDWMSGDSGREAPPDIRSVSVCGFLFVSGWLDK